MKIKKVSIGEIRVPLVTPFKTALRSVENVDAILVCVETEDGEKGYGEAPATAAITGETKGSIAAAVREHIAPSIVGLEIENMDGLQKALHHSIVKNTSAKAAVDMALYDLYGKWLGKPLYQVLGGNKTKLETDVTISVNEVDEMVKDALLGLKSGFHILKIKVGKDSRKDVERLKEIRKAVGPEVLLRVDANQGWNAKEAVRIIGQLEDSGINPELVEQPVPAHDLEGMKFVTAHSYTPILADESIFSVQDAIRVIEERAADLINIKLMKTGGIYGALKICHIAEEFGIECMAGCMLETKLAVSAAANLAAAKGIITRQDLDGPALCKTDPFSGGPEFEGAYITMNKEPGLGFSEVPFMEMK